jgi:hypothetical protein
MHGRAIGRRLAAALGFAAALAAGGCLPEERDFEGTAVTFVSFDAALAEEVRRVLAAEGKAMAGVEVSVANGTVALSGEVGSAATRRAAEQAVLGVEGVNGVRNELGVSAAGSALARG